MTIHASIAITGLGIVSSLGVGTEKFCSDLVKGVSGIQRNTLQIPPVWAPLAEFDFVSELNALNLNEILRKKVLRCGFRATPALQACILAVAEAWSQSELDDISSEEIGLIITGSNINQNDAFDAYSRALKEKQVRPSYGAQFMDTHYVGSISEAFSIRGEGYTLGGASASGGVGLFHGFRALQNSDMKAIIVVGAPMMLSSVELNEFINIGAHYRGESPVLPAFACRPFDSNAAGFVYGQGSGAMVLQKETSDSQKVLARMLGASMCLDANHSTNPSVEGEVRVMKKALKQSGIGAEKIDLINAHGTASRLGDSTEASALAEVFNGSEPWINSTKPITGHCLTAAGVIEAISTVLQLKNGFVHPNITLEKPLSTKLKWAKIKSQNVTLKYAISNSFGFGGINTTQVFSVT